MASRVIEGDCRGVMAGMEENSVDAVVTDPPYGLEFMGREWDAPWKRGEGIGEHNAGFSEAGFTDGSNRLPRASYTGSTNPTCRNCGGTRQGNDRQSRKRCRCDAPDFPDTVGPRIRALQAWHETWAREAFRVLRPGGHLVAFGGTRTFHRLACAIEDAGFEIRDSIGYASSGPDLGLYSWVTGQGFPKNTDVEREIAVKTCPLPGRHFKRTLPEEDQRLADDHVCPMTPESEPWQGWGSATKPSWEPIILARKPMQGGIATNVMRHTTGGLHIAACRLGTDHEPNGRDGESSAETRYADRGGTNFAPLPGPRGGSQLGRWPSNCALTHSPGCRPVGVRRVKAHWGQPNRGSFSGEGVYGNGKGLNLDETGQSVGYADPDGTELVEEWRCVDSCPIRSLDESSDGSSRFFATFAPDDGARFRYVPKASRRERSAGLPEGVVGDHPTRKPVALLRWLVRLVCPPGGTVLDPFLGSGTTGLACVLEGFNFIGIDQDRHYVEDLAAPQIAHAERWGERWLEKAGTAKATPERRYGNGKGLGYTIPRCPEHDASLPSGQNTYGCGCPIVKTKPADDPRFAKPAPALSDLPLFAAVAAD